MRKPSPAPIPQTRLGRIALIGLAAGELAVGAATEGLKRFARGEAGGLGSALLSAPNARRLAARLARLRGAAMKIGQLVSLQGEDVLPPDSHRLWQYCARRPRRCPCNSFGACSVASTAKAGSDDFRRSTTSPWRPPRSGKCIAQPRRMGVTSR